MARVAGEDMAALGTLFERHKQPLFNFLFRFMHEQTIAEDVVLDAFLRVYEHRKSFHDGATFTTWLYTIAHNLAVDICKRQARQQQYIAQRGLELQSTARECDEQTFTRAVTASAVGDAVGALPDDQRAVIILRAYHELSYRDIAHITGVNEQTVRVRAHRARQTLKLALCALPEGVAELCES